MGKQHRSRLKRAVWMGLGLWLAQLVFFRFVPLLITPHLLGQRMAGHPVNQQWVSLDDISSEMTRAVIAAEDNRFCSHWGVDWAAMETVWDEAQAGHRLRGGSTISMQTTKNAYLWLSRSKVRKSLEILLVPSVDRVWGKRRVMEVYLNLAELGPGIYGVQAAAEHHFHTDASRLTAKQASRLAAVMPAPKDWSASRPSRFIRRRARVIENRMEVQGSLADCVLVDG
jgi:monofunctional biosynthetic peptidoglycan transglycosylase